MVPDLVPFGALAITTSDTTEYDPPLAGFVVGVAGDVAIEDAYGVVTTIPAIAGYTYWVRCAKIMNTDTTATGIIGFVL